MEGLPDLRSKELEKPSTLMKLSHQVPDSFLLLKHSPTHSWFADWLKVAGGRSQSWFALKPQATNLGISPNQKFDVLGILPSPLSWSSEGLEGASWTPRSLPQAGLLGLPLLAWFEGGFWKVGEDSFSGTLGVGWGDSTPRLGGGTQCSGKESQVGQSGQPLPFGSCG